MTNLVPINGLSRGLVAVGHQIQVCVDDRDQQRVLGVLKNLVPKLGRSPELVGGHRHRLNEKHLIDVLVVAVDLAAAGDVFIFHRIQHGQDACVVAPHSLEDFPNLCWGHISRSDPTVNTRTL